MTFFDLFKKNSAKSIAKELPILLDSISASKKIFEKNLTLIDCTACLICGFIQEKTKTCVLCNRDVVANIQVPEKFKNQGGGRPKTVLPIFSYEQIEQLDGIIRNWKKIQQEIDLSQLQFLSKDLTELELWRDHSETAFYLKLFILQKHWGGRFGTFTHFKEFLRGQYLYIDRLIGELNKTMEHRTLFNWFRDAEYEIRATNISYTFQRIAEILFALQTKKLKEEIISHIQKRISFTIDPYTIDPTLNGKITVTIMHLPALSGLQIEEAKNIIEQFSHLGSITSKNYYSITTSNIRSAIIGILTNAREVFVKRFGKRLHFTIEILIDKMYYGGKDARAWAVFDERDAQAKILKIHILLSYLIDTVFYGYKELQSTIIHELHHMLEPDYIHSLVYGPRIEAVTMFSQFVYSEEIHNIDMSLIMGENFEKIDPIAAETKGYSSNHYYGFSGALLLYVTKLQKEGIVLSQFDKDTLENVIKTKKGKEIALTLLDEIRLMTPELFTARCASASRLVHELFRNI